MSVVATDSTYAVFVQLRPIVNLSEDDFFEICKQNPDVRLELTATGEVLIMPPNGGETGRRNLRLAGQLDAWTEKNKTGVAFDSSTGFRLPGGSIRSPDAAWMCRERWDAIPREARDRFIPAAPDFVIELRSPTDPLVVLQDTMEEYRAAGVQLGWLLDPLEGRAHVYSPDQPTVSLEKPSELAADPVLPGFVLDLAPIWD